MAAGFYDPNQPSRAPVGGTPSNNPYQGGFNTNYSGYGAGGGNQVFRGYQTSNLDGQNPQNTAGYAHFHNDLAAAHGDSDQLHAISAQWELSNPNAGTNSAEQTALLNMYKGRVGIKNSLSQQIADNPDQLREQENNLNLASGQALGQALGGVRSNFNRRGLLYSGQREMGETSARGAIASQLASGVSSARRDSANSLASAQNAYASVDLANQQDTLNRANQAFDTANQNSIARLQAMQQLGQGIGSAAGSYFGSRQRTDTVSSPTAPTASYNSFYDSPSPAQQQGIVPL